VSFGGSTFVICGAVVSTVKSRWSLLGLPATSVTRTRTWCGPSANVSVPETPLAVTVNCAVWLVPSMKTDTPCVVIPLLGAGSL
jgi:hypothetical protein